LDLMNLNKTSRWIEWFKYSSDSRTVTFFFPKNRNSPGNCNSPGNFTILVVFWDHIIFFVALLTIVTLFAVFLFVLNFFWQQKWIFVIRVCRCSLFALWGLPNAGKNYITLFSSKNIFYCPEKTHIPYTKI